MFDHFEFYRHEPNPTLAYDIYISALKSINHILLKGFCLHNICLGIYMYMCVCVFVSVYYCTYTQMYMYKTVCVCIQYIHTHRHNI